MCSIRSIHHNRVSSTLDYIPDLPSRPSAPAGRTVLLCANARRATVRVSTTAVRGESYTAERACALPQRARPRSLPGATQSMQTDPLTAPQPRATLARMYMQAYALAMRLWRSAKRAAASGRPVTRITHRLIDLSTERCE